MPYILVNIVLGIVSWLFFCVTSAALLSASGTAHRWLPERVRARRARAFVLYLVVLLVASFAVGRLAGLRASSPDVADAMFLAGLVNATVLSYRFMDRRYFLGMPKARRWLLLGTCSVAATCVPAFAVVAAVFGLFVIR